ncbi:MAG: hypothetical protein ACI8RD_003928 [Bacillariaceae sp.]|jgi:hypothetical protein
MHIFIYEMLITSYRSGMMIQLEFDPNYTKEFLKKRPLHGFGLSFCRRHSHIVRAITDGGRALIPLSTHQLSLHIMIPLKLQFDTVSDFVGMLNGYRN